MYPTSDNGVNRARDNAKEKFKILYAEFFGEIIILGCV